MTKQIDVKLNETHRLPDGRLVRCVEAKVPFCEGCVFYADDHSCNKKDSDGRHVACKPCDRKDKTYRLFVLVEEPAKRVSLPVCNAEDPGTFGGPSPKPVSEETKTPSVIAVADVVAHVRDEMEKWGLGYGRGIFKRFLDWLEANKPEPEQPEPAVPAPQSAVEQIRAKVVEMQADANRGRGPGGFLHGHWDGRRVACFFILDFIDSLPSEPEPKPCVPHGIAQLEVQVHNLETSNEQLRSALSKRKAENKRALSKVRTDAKERDASVTSLRGRVDAMSRRASTYRKERDKLRVENERLKAGVPHGIAQLEVQVHNLETSNEQLQKQLAEAEEFRTADYNEHRELTAALRHDRDEARRQLAMVRKVALADNEKYREETTGVYTERDALKRQLADVNVMCDCLRVDVSNAKEATSQAGPLLRTAVDESVVKVRAEVAGWVRELQKESFDSRPTIGRGWTADKLADKLLAKLKPARMTFEEAMAAVQDGKRVRRQVWGNNAYLFMHDDTWMIHPHCRNNRYYVLYECDYNATDWVVVESEASNE